MFSRAITIIIGTAALAAVVISFNLTVKHITGTSGVGWFDAGCSNESGPGKMNCAKVLSSPYSYFPPKHSDKPGGMHIPVSFLGFVYYSTLFVWLVGIGRPSISRRWVHLLPLLFVGMGLVFSGYFVFVMYRIITEWCIWCLVTHALNLLIAFGLIALWPRRKHENVVPAVEGASSERAPAAMTAIPHPTNRLLLTTLLAIVFVNYGHLFFFEWRDLKKDSNHLHAELNYLRSNVGGFVAQWQLTPVCALPPRPDDPVHVFTDAAQPEALLDVVVFSDFECPGCAKFAEFFEKQVAPLFDNRVRLVFRHFPLDQACNSRSTKTLHAHACSASFLVEGARVLGGSTAFWKAHNYLFEHRNEIAAGTMTADRLAKAIGLDAAALQTAAEPAGLTARIAQDVEQGGICGVRGTPSVFVEGKRIETAAAANIEFWNKMADWYWLEKARMDRPQSTRPPPTTPSLPQGVGLNSR